MYLRNKMKFLGQCFNNLDGALTGQTHVQTDVTERITTAAFVGGKYAQCILILETI